METNRTPDNTPRSESGAPMGFGRRAVVFILCLVVVAAGFGIASMIVRSSPKAKKRPPVRMVPLVSVETVSPQTQAVTIQAMGSVVPARELSLKSRVAGEILQVHPEFLAGGILRKGASIVNIDDVDYELILAQKRSAVADARFNLKLELGRQDVARREWELLNGDNPAPEADSELALRKPHLEKNRSDLEAAEADLEAARLQLARTDIRVPFNAIVRTTHVEKGSQVAAQEVLATLVGTDAYWVQVSIPVDRLQWIDIPRDHSGQGAKARVTYHGDAVRTGRVVKLLSDLEDQGRMARLIVAIEDPLGLEAPAEPRPAMLIGEYVRVEIQGRNVPGAYRIPRSALRDNTHVWVVDRDDRLQVRPVEIVWRDTHSVLIKDGLQPGARLIISNLATPVPGMAVQVNGAVEAPIKPASVHETKDAKG